MATDGIEGTPTAYAFASLAIAANVVLYAVLGSAAWLVKRLVVRSPRERRIGAIGFVVAGLSTVYAYWANAHGGVPPAVQFVVFTIFPASMGLTFTEKEGWLGQPMIILMTTVANGVLYAAIAKAWNRPSRC